MLLENVKSDNILREFVKCKLIRFPYKKSTHNFNFYIN